ncbi:MAG: type phosphodiesterase/nucleotide pyrophosphatase [Planctomycetaceae bacterium]|nr:type phosphodiesterase/nucleotide pyrophosphatase [Planctomycetaceae bacterium]
MVSFAIAKFLLTPVFLPAYIGPGAGISFIGSFFGLIIAFGLLFVSLLTWPIRMFLMWLRRRRVGLKSLAKRVVVVGLDGLDPGRVRRLMAEGRLPHLKQLAERGTFTNLATTLPPISPVAWSSFQTGVNPGKHNIFDFLNRNLRTYLPELSSTRIVEGASGWRNWVGLGGGSIRMLRKSQQFWKVLGEFGVFSTILRVPITFPPERFFGLSLSAMCTPDLRGTQGSFTLFSTDPEECRETTGGLRILVERIGHRIEAILPGPPRSSGTEPREFRTRLLITILPEQNAIELRVGRERIRLPLQQDSPWVHVEFRDGWFTRVSGICRFRVENLQPHFRLYVSPIHLDPERPAMPISHPSYYSLYLGKLHDAFATLGLAEDTWALNAGAITEAAFLDQAWAIHDERERMFFDALRRMQRGLTVCVFDAPDRIQHMFYRHDVADHSANAGRDVTRYAQVLDQMYERMDDLVGRTAKELDDQAVLVVLSDHGFCDFSRGVNLNAWLREHGYLVTQQEGGTGDYLKGVDWSKTRAYAFGLSGIYLNQQGRESQGIVAPAAAAALRAEIISRLTGLPDPERGRSAIKRVYDAHQAYRGPYAANGPDLVVGYERGYRASWENAVGRCDGPVIQDNTRYWSGDHCVDPELVPGVLFCNRSLVTDRGASILDLAPTILELFGVPAPGYLDGKSLLPKGPVVSSGAAPTPATTTLPEPAEAVP